MKLRSYFALQCLVVFVLPVMPGKAMGKVDPDLPQPMDQSVTQSLLENSPFTRPLDLSESLQLTGVAYLEGKPVATLVDRETKKSHLVSGEPNDLGWWLAEANISNEMKLTNVKVMVGNELVTIHYNGSQHAFVSTFSNGLTSYPPDSEAIGYGENGKPYVKAVLYISDADRERIKKMGMENEQYILHMMLKFGEIMAQNNDQMLKASPQQRAAMAKRALVAGEAEAEAKKKARLGK